MGESLEKDQQFWEHSTWDEEKEDEDYNCSEGESFYEYETDSDFDDSESDEEDEIVENVETKKKKFKTKSYVDPAIVRARKVQNATKEHSGVKRIKRTKSIEYGIANRSKRDTTMRKTEAIMAQQEREKIIREAKRAVKKVKHGSSGGKMPSQEELLEEAKRVEKMNRESLEALLASEVEKRRYTKYTKQKLVNY